MLAGASFIKSLIKLASTLVHGYVITSSQNSGM